MENLKFKGTPGRWQVLFSLDENYNEDALAIFPEHAKDDGLKYEVICKVSPIDRINEVDEANADLIAAAPELLNAAINVLNLWEHDMLLPAEAQELKQAINKALGKEEKDG